MGREDPQLKLRLTEEMKEDVTAAARANGRSVNMEIVDRLTKSFSGEFVPADALSDIGSKFNLATQVMKEAKKLSNDLIKSEERELQLIDKLLKAIEKIDEMVEINKQTQEVNQRLLKLLETKAGS